MIPNEKEFDARLDRIGKLYEDAKDALNELAIGRWKESHDTPYMRVYEALRELRDIAATGLKANHEIKDN